MAHNAHTPDMSYEMNFKHFSGLTPRLIRAAAPEIKILKS